jgi:alanine racemase
VEVPRLNPQNASHAGLPQPPPGGEDPIPPLRPTFAEIDLDCIAHNVRELIRAATPPAELMAVVKADAYGHGIREVAAECLASGATRLGVAVLDEALLLRRSGVDAPILTLGPLFPHQAPAAVEHGIAAAVSGLDEARALSEAAAGRRKTARLHVKVDTGMSRLGIWPDQSGVALIERMARLPRVEVEGVFTHFAAADETDKTHALMQFERFMGFLDMLRRAGVEIKLRHAANSAALLELPQTHLDFVRPGVLIGGIFPSEEVRHDIDLRPALTLRTAVGFVRQVPGGCAVSYGCTYQTPAGGAALATVPLGYHDGYKRRLSNRARMLVHGQAAPVRGRVCMDQTIIDVGGIPGVARGDEVVAIGRQGTERVTAEELASAVGTIAYEIVATIGRRVARLYVKQGRPCRLCSPLGEWNLRGRQDLPWPWSNAAVS